MTVALFLVCVLLIFVLFRFPDPYVAVGTGAAVAFAATEAVGRLFGQGGVGVTRLILRFTRSLLAAAVTEPRA